MPTPDVLTQTLTELIPILKYAGFRVTLSEDEHVRTEMPLEPNRNHLGSVYAGSLVAMAEASGGALMMQCLDITQFKVMVRHISIDYHRMALTDVHCDLHLPDDFHDSLMKGLAEEGKAFYRLPVPVYDAEDEGVATAYLEYRLKLNA